MVLWISKNKDRLLLMLGVFLVLPLATIAQEKRAIEGTVTTADGSPLPGVNVLVKGANIGTSTDTKGHYEISVAGEVTLIFSMIGFKDTEIKTQDYAKNVINIQLEEETFGLDEMTVAGYSKVETKHVASSVAKGGYGQD